MSATVCRRSSAQDFLRDADVSLPKRLIAAGRGLHENSNCGDHERFSQSKVHEDGHGCPLRLDEEQL